jgi:peptidoglycan/LPS O-acetylase OafA/YrhL
VSAPARLGYHPALDGVRAVSILAVMAYHTGWIRGGFLGVDVFFVLSGFLITSLLLGEFDATGDVSFRAFYARRALRLLPALAPVVLVAGAAMLAWDPSRRTALFLLSVVFYVANWSMLHGLRASLLGHTWSLSFEEQFYALWPPLLLLMLRTIRRRGVLLAVLVGAAALAVVYRFAIMPTPWGMRRLYLALDAHADPVLIGCAAALLFASPWLGRTSRAARGWDALAGLGALVLAAAFLLARFPEDYARWSASTLAALGAVPLIIAGALPSSRCARLLGREPLGWIGRRSYALYLWHYPVFYLADGPLAPGRTLEPLAALLGWALTFALAAASFRYIERPALALKAAFAR